MPTNRQDAWSHNEDLLLAEVVLRKIREGGTQLQAFEEVGKQLARTAAACGFRWNSYVRKQYKSGIELAKKQRKEQRNQFRVNKELSGLEQKTVDVLTTVESESQVVPFEKLVRLLRGLYDQLEKSHEEDDEIKQSQEIMRELEQKIYHLTVENEKLTKELTVIQKDYKSLIEIMERARQLVGQQEEESVVVEK